MHADRYDGKARASDVKIEMMAALHSFWQRHRSTALRSLLLAALLHRLNCLAFLAASSPVWLLTAFLLGAVLVHSDAASEDEDRHLYKKIRPHLAAGSSSSSDAESSVTSMDEHLVVVGDVAAWTADDEHRIRSIGSLELERDARLEKLMSRRSSIYRRRNLIDLDVHIPAVHHHCDDTGSAPSSLLRAAHRTYPFDIHQRDPDDGKAAAMLRRHETFADSGSSDAPPARTSRFIRPYFVADDVQEAGAAGDNSNSSSSSSSPSSSAASDHQTQQQHAVVGVQEAEGAGAAATTSTPHEWGGNGMSLEAVDVELISDSSDDDMSLPGDDAAAAAALHSNPPDQLDEDEEDSFEVESITQQVAAVKQQPRVTAVEEPVSSPSGHDENASSKELVEENKKMDRELSEIREHHILGPVPVINSSTATSSGVGVGAARAVVTPSLAAAAAAAAPASTPQAPASAPPVAASVPPAAAPAQAPPAAAAAPAPAPPAAVSAPPAAASRKPSSKSKTASKKPVFGFFRK
ncbi:hypothetical protein BS78_01G000800 [Paspalum vaginatum]|nr:hypothetical protein BS78_01G000800 [Paspalum vaginatum]